MPRTLPRLVRSHVEKARESALLAVEVYNKPATAFRSGGYIVLMCIAWTSLFHAVFFRNGVKPFYRDPKRPRYYERVDSDYKAWELKECVRKHFGSQNSAMRRNLEFFVGLRNKIEHRSMPELDIRIFGECQALLFNFEDTLVECFGFRYALNESLLLALQFSQLRDRTQEAAVASLHHPLARNVDSYISAFRSGLTKEEFDDLQYSYKFFLVPKVSNHEASADFAVEFVKYDHTKPDEMAAYERLVTMIRPNAVQVANLAHLRPADVCRAVEPVVKQVCGDKAKFVPSYHHAKACSFYGIRPPSGDPDPRKTDVRYCHYDVAHKDYVYTELWKKFLIAEMKRPGQYERVLQGS
jgi:hypothetical protein